MKRLPLLLALAALLVALPSSCLRAQRAQRNRAEAEKAEADLARAQAEAIRKGQRGGVQE